jgi:UDP-N-acetylglucosamine 2-epimerase (non-hydrolysing)
VVLGEAGRLLDEPDEYGRMSRVKNPYGDGTAAVRIADAVLAYYRR